MTPAEQAQIDRIEAHAHRTETKLDAHAAFMDERYGAFIGALGTLTTAVIESNTLLRGTLAQRHPKTHANGRAHSAPDLASIQDDPDTGVRMLAVEAMKKKAAAEYVMSWVRGTSTILKFLLTLAAVLALVYGIVTRLGAAKP